MKKYHMTLPSEWVWTTLENTCEIILGQSPSSDTYNTNGVGLPFYQGKAEFGDLYPTTVKWCSKPNKLAKANDILISVRAPVGPTNLCQEESCIGRGLAAIRPQYGMPSKYFLYYLRSIEKDWDSKATGTTFKAITGNVLRRQEVPLAPFPEQERIVARIESLFTQLDTGVAGLKRLQVALKRYKASVLKAACEGRLVPQDSSDEPAEELLRRLTYERRNKWQERQILKGKKPDKIKYDEPAKPDFSELPELPKGWEWSKIDNICAYVTDGFHETPKPTPEGYPYVLATQIKPEGIDFNNCLYVSETDHKRLFAKTQVKRDDILVVSIGVGSGIPAIVNVDFEFSFKNVAILKKLDSVDAKYIFYFLLQKRDELFHRITKGGAQPFLSLEVLREIPIPIPPLAEQHRIVAEVERRLSVAREIEVAVESALARSARLRQTVLKRAFEGQL